jgi:hypothetical protein
MTGGLAMRLNRRSFFADIGYEPHPGQEKVHASRARRRVVACGVRWGKSRAAAVEALAAAMEPRERSVGWIVAPTYDLADKVFREVVIIGAEHLRPHIVSLKENEKRLVIRNLAGGLSEIRGKSADNPVSLLGEGLDWLVIDEAARLKPVIWEGYCSQRLIDKRGWVLMISTPRGKGWFYDAFRQGQGLDSDYESWNAPSWENPYLERALIDAERGRLPERVFRQEYGGEFLEGSGQVFRYVRESATGELRDPVPGERYVAGLDLAQVHDFTVLVIMTRQRQVVFTDRFHRLDWSQQIVRIKAALERYGNPQVWVDSTGAGEPIFENLRREGIKAEGYVLTQSSKAALVDNLSILLEKREIVLPRPALWPQGIDELEAFEFSVTDSGNVRRGAPGGMHDDCVIALALAAWPLRARTGDGIVLVGVVHTPFGRRAREDAEWRDPREGPPDEPYFGTGFSHLLPRRPFRWL